MKNEIIKNSLISLLQVGDSIIHELTKSQTLEEYITHINDKFITTVSGEFLIEFNPGKVYKYKINVVVINIINKKRLKLKDNNYIYYDPHHSIIIKRNKKIYYIYK